MNLRLLFSTFTIGLLLFAGGAQSYVAPAVYITELEIDSTEISLGNQIRGSFSLWNSNNYIVPGIVAELMIMELDDEGYPETLIGRTLLAEEILLSPDQRKRVEFTYEPPENLLSGNYYFQVNVYSNTGVLMNWINQEVSIEGNEKFLKISNPLVVGQGQEFLPLVGAVFSVDDYPEIKFDLVNPSAEDITAVPKISIFRRQVNLEKMKDLEEDTLTLNAQEGRTVSYKMPALEKPESYLAELKFYDQAGHLISNSVFYRWIVEGSGAEVLAVETDHGSYQTGEVARFNVHFVGAADGSEMGEADLLIEVVNQNNEIVGQALHSINLDDESSLVAEVLIEQDVSRAGVKTTILQENKILAEHIIGSLEVLPEAIEEITEIDYQTNGKKIPWWHLLGIIIFIVLMFIIFKFLKKHEN